MQSNIIFYMKKFLTYRCFKIIKSAFVYNQSAIIKQHDGQEWETLNFYFKLKFDIGIVNLIFSFTLECEQVVRGMLQ